MKRPASVYLKDFGCAGVVMFVIGLAFYLPEEVLVMYNVFFMKTSLGEMSKFAVWQVLPGAIIVMGRLFQTCYPNGRHIIWPVDANGAQNEKPYWRRLLQTPSTALAQTVLCGVLPYFAAVALVAFYPQATLLWFALVVLGNAGLLTLLVGPRTLVERLYVVFSSTVLVAAILQLGVVATYFMVLSHAMFALMTREFISDAELEESEGQPAGA